MATKLTTPLKREIEIDGQTYTLIVTADGIKLSVKRFRSPVAEVSFRQLLNQPQVPG